MRFGGRRESDNVESQSGGGGFGFGGGGGGGASMLIGLVMSRFGIVGVLILVGLGFLIGGNPLGLAGGGQQGAPAQKAEARGQNVCRDDPRRQVLCQVLASTEDRFGELFQAEGRRYEPAVLVFYPGSGRSGCGAAQAAMGPFYCPTDRRVYLDTSFFDELARRYGASGDFPQAYVIAHEVGHHVQTLLGTSDRIRRAQAGVSEREGNALQVRMELQADCLAGVWAAREQGVLEPGDIEEGLTAAAAIGDDTLQRAGGGTVVPESFTHGSSAQRQEALQRGYRGGTLAACEQYTAGI